ncbi:MAG: demethoxyubiquinone hydroxylase family protein [Bacillota bacterium]
MFLLSLLSLFGVKERLRYFLALESAQVRLYQAQQRLVSDPTLYRALGHFAEVEVGHVENLKRTLEQYEIHPSGLNRIAKPLGAWVGEMSDALGLDAMIKLDVRIEQMAAQEYRQLIASVHDPALLDLLWKHMIDEEMHKTWFESTLLKLNSQASCNK